MPRIHRGALQLRSGIAKRSPCPSQAQRFALIIMLEVERHPIFLGQRAVKVHRVNCDAGD
jgi:hypothetical protein